MGHPARDHRARGRRPRPGSLEALEPTRRELARIAEEDPELHAAILEIVVFEVHGILDGALRAPASGGPAR